jgi:hypothetical protein
LEEMAATDDPGTAGILKAGIAKVEAAAGDA